MKISVVIPTYNRYSFLKEAICSILKQSFLPCEIIVVDDGSTDDTIQIKEDFPSIKYIYQKNNGVSSARNIGILASSGEWIALLDSDDQWHTEKLKIQWNFHQENPQFLMSYTDEIWIRNNKEVKIPKKFHKIGKNIFQENLSYCNIAPSSSFIHKSLFQNIGFFDEDLEVCEDYDLWLRVLLNNKIALIDKKLLYKYAGHEDQLSFKYWGMDRFRVLTLERILKNSSEEQKRLIREELIKKYILLKKGAVKYNKALYIKLYESKLNYFIGYSNENKQI